MGCNNFKKVDISEINLIGSKKNENILNNENFYKNCVYSNEINGKKIEVELIYSANNNLILNNEYLEKIIFRIISNNEKTEIKFNLFEEVENILNKKISLKNIIYENEFENEKNKVKINLKSGEENKPNKNIYQRNNFKEKKIVSKTESNINYGLKQFELKEKENKFFNNLKNIGYYNTFNKNKNTFKNVINKLRKTNSIKKIFNIKEIKKNISKEKEIQLINKRSFKNIRSK